MLLNLLTNLFILTKSNCIVDHPNWVGDAFCDEGKYNTLECNWDGGDCCEETCQDTQFKKCINFPLAILKPLFMAS